MIVRKISDLDDTEFDIKTPHWRAKRIVLARDKVGFSLHETTLYAGTVNEFWYANHIEAVFIVEGEGTITDLATGETHELGPGSMYLLNEHDKHVVRPRTEIRTVCVFNPRSPGARRTTRTGCTRSSSRRTDKLGRRRIRVAARHGRPNQRHRGGEP